MEMQDIRKYPVGMQTFADIINDKYMYAPNGQGRQEDRG